MKAVKKGDRYVNEDEELLTVIVDPAVGTTWAETLGIKRETGYFYKEDMPLIKVVAVVDYGHWNFMPAAQVIWNIKNLQLAVTISEAEEAGH